MPAGCCMCAAARATRTASPCCRPATAALRDWWRVGPAGPWVFPAPRATAPSCTSPLLKARQRRRPAPGSPSTVAFTPFATHLLEAGVDILTIQAPLAAQPNHKTTLTYLRVRTTHIQQVKSPLEDLDLSDE